MESSILFEIILIVSGICVGVSLTCLTFAYAIVRMLKDDDE